jgi:hypothetical protein
MPAWLVDTRRQYKALQGTEQQYYKPDAQE